ncbi:MAG TPA: hypothetical protein VIM99_05490 [Blastocatellia bacterium]
MGNSLSDIPRLLLTAAVRWMPAERGEWGAAMLAELAQLQRSSTRWRFALGCACAALSAPRRGGRLQPVMNQKIRSVITTLGLAALIGFILVLPLVILQFTFSTVKGQNVPDLIALFGLMWLLSMAFVVILAPIMRTVRAGNNVLTRPIGLLFRGAFLVIIAWGWGLLLIDQLPCFLGVPNCD